MAGLAAALALHARGRSVLVIERRADENSEGAGIQIGPNGVAVLRQLGLADAVAMHAGVPGAIRVHDGASGRPLTELPLGAWIETRHGAPYWVVHRADLMRVLIKAVRAAGIEIRSGHSWSGAVETADGVDITMSDSARVPGAALIGADGLWSGVRQAHFDSAAPSLTGRAAARALIDIDAADGIDAEVISVWMARGAHVVAYPVRAGRMLNLVVIAPSEHVVERWSEPVSVDDILRRVAGFTPSLSRVLAAAAPWRQWPLMTRAPLSTFARGRIAVVGDAAHPMLPFLAQGAVMALEDSIALADCLHESHDDVVAGLHAFSHARVARTRRVVDTAAQQGRIYHLSGVARLARDMSLRVMPPSLLMARYDWLYGARSRTSPGRQPT